MAKPKVVACVIARTVSTRLHVKVLRHLSPDFSMLDFLITRIKAVKCVDEIYICTSSERVDDILEDVAVKNNVKIYRGSPDQVIERILTVGEMSNADVVLRITADNPLTSFEYIDAQVMCLEEHALEYVRVIDVPIGATAEVIRLAALKNGFQKVMDPIVSEYMMLYLFEPKTFKCGVLKVFKNDYSDYSITVDTPDDLDRTKIVLQKLTFDPVHILLKDIIALYEDKTLNVPFRKIAPSGVMKLPFGKTASYQEFKEDMKRRASESMLFKLYDE